MLFFDWRYAFLIWLRTTSGTIDLNENGTLRSHSGSIGFPG